MISLVFWLLAPSCLLLASSDSLTKGFQTLDAPFSLDQSANQEDWRFFMQAPMVWRMQLWDFYEKQGKRLKDWHWTWRLGWVKTCVAETSDRCDKLTKEALQDPALVVRAAAVQALGQRFEGSQNEAIINELVHTFEREGNSRNGKPLFIQNYILFALRQIGGKTAENHSRSLANRSASTRQYWSRLKLP